MKRLFWIVLAVLLHCSGVAQVLFVKDSLDQYINREMQRWNIPGMAVAVVKDGKVITMKGYGIKEIGKADKVDAFTLFQIASNTKAFTGTAVALLDYQKRINLDDLVTKHIPDFRLKDDCATGMVTVRDMLCHRIGFSTFQSDFLNWDCNMTTQELITNMRNVTPVNTFRTKYGYCNMGFVTAGEVLAVVTDTNWHDFIQYRFFQPLNMQRSSTHYSEIITDKNAAVPHTIINHKVVKINYANIDNIGACASINSCVNDMSHWVLMQLDSGRYNGREVFPASVIKATQTSNMLIRDANPSRMPYSHFSTYGLGWKLEDMYGFKIVSHDGGANGFVTNTTLLPELNAGFVILTNTDANWFYSALRQQLINALTNQKYFNVSEKYFEQYEQNEREEGNRIDKLKQMVAAKPTLQVPLTEVAGQYNNEVYGKMEIKLDKDGLVMYLSHHPKVKGSLSILSADKLLCTFNDPTYGIHEFPVEVKEGRIKAITVKVNDFIDYLPYRFVKE